jgi:hypothetical protein
MNRRQARNWFDAITLGIVMGLVMAMCSYGAWTLLVDTGRAILK